MRILWFTNTPGLISGSKNLSGGWISSLQEQVEKQGEFELGLVFYSDHQKNPFRQGSTHYFPVVRKGNTRFKRKMMEIMAQTSRNENLGRFLEIIEHFKPDLIHIHGTENPFGLIIPHTGNIPVLLSIQGIMNSILKKYFSGIDTYRFSDWRKNWDFFLARNYTIYKKRAAIEREILASVKHVAGRTDWDRLIAGLLAPKASYYHINESLRPVFYQSEWKPPRNKKIRLFSTVSDQPYKGVNVLLEAAIELHRAGLEFEWRVAGIDWSAVMLKMFHHEVGLNEIPVHLCGKLDQDEMVNELLGADCFIQVSQIENSSNSLAEAMMLGLPCIATAAGGTFSMLRNGKDGVLAPEGDPFALAGTILEYSNRYEELIEMGASARVHALKRHDPETVIGQLMSTYKTLLKNDKRREYHEV